MQGERNETENKRINRKRTSQLDRSANKNPEIPQPKPRSRCSYTQTERGLKMTENNNEFSFGRDFLLQKKSPTGSNPAPSTKLSLTKKLYREKLSILRFSHHNSNIEGKKFNRDVRRTIPCLSKADLHLDSEIMPNLMN